jgi:uncharacterized protein YdeI (YjbR/CyaY-like superfamily)
MAGGLQENVSEKYVSRWDVLDELICFGWIDGLRRKLDEHRTMRLIAQRKVEHWVRTYKKRAEKLMAEGKMHPSGLAAIAASKSNGLWNFKDDVDDLIIPKALSDELSKHNEETDFFNSINDSNKRFALRWVKLAKTEKTSAKRIKELARLSARGEKLSGT